MADPAVVRELRLAVLAEDYDHALRFYRDVLGLPEQASYTTPDGGRVTILDAGRATLELADPAYSTYIDEVEVGRRVAGHIRVAFEVADSAATTAALVASGGATLIAEPTRTPWNSLNSRLDGPPACSSPCSPNSTRRQDDRTGRADSSRRRVVDHPTDRPVQRARRVRLEHLQAFHPADLRRYPHQRAAVAQQPLHASQPRDGRRQRHQILPFGRAEVHQRPEDLPPVGYRFLDQLRQPSPPRQRGVLPLTWKRAGSPGRPKHGSVCRRGPAPAASRAKRVVEELRQLWITHPWKRNDNRAPMTPSVPTVADEPVPCGQSRCDPHPPATHRPNTSPTAGNDPPTAYQVAPSAAAADVARLSRCARPARRRSLLAHGRRPSATRPHTRRCHRPGRSPRQLPNRQPPAGR
jgi:lactoylglutathione lyase